MRIESRAWCKKRSEKDSGPGHSSRGLAYQTVFSIQGVSQFEENVSTSLGVMVKLERQFQRRLHDHDPTGLLAAPGGGPDVGTGADGSPFVARGSSRTCRAC